MAELIDVFNQDDITSEDFLKNITGKELIIYEQPEANRIYVKFDGTRFIIKPRSLKSDEINLIDLSLQKIYSKCFIFFNTLPQYIQDMMNTKWWFMFEYFYDEKQAHITYNKIPKNNLILTSIVKGGKHKFNYDEIVEYAKLFDVESIPVIFKGKLNQKQLELINLYLKTSEEDLKFIFDNDSFAKFFYNILNPYHQNSFLMSDGEYNENLEKIIIRINGDDKYSFAVLNPLYQRNSEENQTEYSHVFSLILMSFLEFLQLKEIEKVKITGLTKDEIYINLICTLFNEYINNIKDDIESWEFFVPNFIKEDKFKINIDLIRNKDTQKLIKSSEKVEYIFKVILGSYKKHKKKPIGVMKESTVDFFNKMVDRISKHIESLLNINRDYIFQKVDLLNFNDYFNIKFDRDAAGDVYPDMNKPLSQPEMGNSKKGKDGKGIKK